MPKLHWIYLEEYTLEILVNALFLVGNDNPLTWYYLGSDILVGVLRILCLKKISHHQQHTGDFISISILGSLESGIPWPSAASSSPYSTDDALVGTSTSSRRLDHSTTSRPAGCGFSAGAIGTHDSGIITWIPARFGDTIKRQEEDRSGRHEREITSVIKFMYDEPWPNWKVIPAATWARMFDKWAENFTWDKNDDELVKAIFNTRASKRFSGMMEDVREKKEHLTQWCRPELKKALYHYWETDEKYLHRKATNKRNRASEKCTKSLDRPVSMAEVFKQTHTLKVNKEQFADKRSSDIWDDFTNNTTVATQQAAESGTNATVDPDHVWRKTVSEPSEKNRIFGIGGFLASTLRTSVFAPQASFVSLTSPAPASQEEAVNLREQVHLLNQNIQDMARQLHESEEGIQALHDELSRRAGVHDADVKALKDQLREELRLMQEHRRQMGVTGKQMHAGSSSAAQVPPLHPLAPPEDDDADYVEP
ncbi:hypothetical protein PIB30_084792 [Stylosanthes scabra]|uniref:Uncharacterized protein n=1 Tax=Stylosanthes scabra TaxID=79078 RepID=A0ABU6WQY7_9FABA|nr:hypothetical protein [Stylosanthes scabra]